MFNSFKRNVYSQNGEDGILQELLKKLNLEKNGWCCEFGATTATFVLAGLVARKMLSAISDVFF